MYLLMKLNKDTGEVTTDTYAVEWVAKRDCRDLRDPYVGCVIESFTTDYTTIEALSLLMEELTEAQDTNDSLVSEVERLSGYEDSYHEEYARAESLAQENDALLDQVVTLEAKIRTMEDANTVYVYTPYLLLDDTLKLSSAGKGLWSIETGEHLLRVAPKHRVVYVRHRKDEDPEDVIRITQKETHHED